MLPRATPSPILNMKLLRFFVTTSNGFREFSFKDLYPGLDCLLHSSLPRIAHRWLMMPETLPQALGYQLCQPRTSVLLFSSFQTGHFPCTRVLVAASVSLQKVTYLFFISVLSKLSVPLNITYILFHHYRE